MPEEPAGNGKRRVNGRIPPDDYHRFQAFVDKQGIKESDAFRRVFHEGLKHTAPDTRSLRDHTIDAVTYLGALGLIMWLIGNTLPGVPEHTGALAAFLTFTIGGILWVAAGLIGLETPRTQALRDRLGLH